ncbi:TolC family protein [Tenacibaculum piscium]|uniref:TolC family protein n=1 Tax=Tenacibaculum piscium TaxID=1458515 RepID=UPI001F2A82AD|nr:TolC family protein [Tenacibaculum piscium]
MKKYLSSVFIIFCSGFLFAQEQLNLSMQEAIEYAIKNNYQNKIAVNNIKAAKQRKWETTTIGLPQIDGNVDYQNWLKQQVSLLPAEITGGEKGGFIPVKFGTKQTVNANVTVSQLIFDGSYIVGLQSAKTYLKISEQAKEKTELTTREAVINSYGNILVVEKMLGILERNKKVVQQNLYETQKIYDNGLTELEDVEQLQITLGTIENNYRNTKRMKSIAYQMLNISLGNTVNHPIKITDSLDDLVVANTDLNLLTKIFNVDKHIDFKMAENEKVSKELLMKLEQSKALPTLSAFVNYGANANADDFNFTNTSQKWFDYSMLGVKLKVPIFSSFGRHAKTARAKIELESAEIKTNQIKEQLKLQAKTAKSNYQLSIESFQTATKNLALAQRIEKKQQIKFFEGISSSFELSQAQNQLYTQQNNYVQSMLKVITQKAQLENALNIPVK